jgi:hypothetical protein
VKPLFLTKRRTEVPVNAGYLEILNGQPYLRYVMTNFIDGMGRPIPAEAFENDPGSPGAPNLSPEDLKTFREETAAQADRIKNHPVSLVSIRECPNLFVG